MHTLPSAETCTGSHVDACVGKTEVMPGYEQYKTIWKTDSIVPKMDICFCCAVGTDYNNHFNNTQCTGPVSYEVKTDVIVPGMVAGFKWPDLYCGTDHFNATCVNATIPMTEEGWKFFWGEFVSTSTVIFTITLSTATADLPENMVKAMNCLRCSFVSGYYNNWMLMGGVYYVARYYEYHKDVESYYSSWYPYLCTCTKDVEFIQS